MNKQIIKSSFVLALLLCMQMPAAMSQIINTESFDGTVFPPANWTITGGGGSQWVRRTTGTNPVCNTHSGAAMARFSAFMEPSGSQEEMATPVINYSGASGSIPAFSLWVYRDNSSTAGDSITIFVNTTNTVAGATRIGGVARSRFFVLPVNEPANGWYQYTFNVPASFNTDTNYIVLRGTSRGGANIYVDDVQWTEFPTACAGTPVAGNVIASDTLICGGSGSTTLALDTSVALGGISYQWQSSATGTDPWTNFGTSTSTINTGTLSASTYFRAYVTCSNGGVTDTSTTVLVTVNPNPNPTVTLNLGPTLQYCTNTAPIELIASGAVSYTWLPNIAINPTGDTAMASPTATTTYIVTGVDSLGCSGSASILFNVSISPAVNAFVNNDTICSGQSVNLNANVQGPGFGIQYLWQPGALAGAQQTVTPATSTTYVVGATSPQSGCTGYDSVSVTVNTTPVASFTYVVSNLTYTFTNTSTSSGTATYLWNFGDGNTDTTQNPVYTYATNGTYTITLTVTDGGCTHLITQTITVVGINNLQLSNGAIIMLHPNPVKDMATLSFEYDELTIELSIINSLGQEVMRKNILATNNLFKADLDFSELSAGVYFLALKSEKDNVFVKVIKK